MSEIFEYVASKNGKKRVGVMYATTNDKGEVMIGFSLCNPLDKFRKDAGVGKAKSRAMKFKDLSMVAIKHATDEIVDAMSGDYGEFEEFESKHVIVPHSMVKPLKQFIARCKQYYQNEKLPEWSVNIFSSKDEIDSIISERRNRYRGDHEIVNCN